MEMTQVQQPPPPTANPPLGPTQETSQKVSKPRGRRPRSIGDASGDSFRRIRINSDCCSALDYLKQELGLRSENDVILSLLQQVGPAVVSVNPPNLSRCPHPIPMPVCSVPRPVCMAHSDDDRARTHTVEPGSAPLVKQPVRATVVQASTVFLNTTATLDKAEKLIAGAAAYGSQLIVFPEAFIGGYPRCMMPGGLISAKADDDLNKYFASAIEVPGPEVNRLSMIASKYKVCLVIGVVERAACYLFSTVLFFDNTGQILGQHRKLMPMASESAVWHSGEKSAVPIYETSVGKIGGFICWDNKLPLLRTALYAKGVEIYCAPTSDARDTWKASATHIALEGCCFVLSANQFCRRKDYPLQPGNSVGNTSLDAIVCAGGSIIVSPSGTILAGPNYGGECLISADLDLGETSQAKMELGEAWSNLGSNHASCAANVPNPILFSMDMKTEFPDELSC